jgi:diaminopimelate epimerase
MGVGIPFLKGHGTENDFVLLPDVDAGLDLTPARVAALCDRGRGLGADGVLRVVRTRFVEDAPSDVDDDAWFMDYRNADGSVAEMCGNGARLFARYLVDSGLQEATEFVIGTRAGAKPVVVHPNGSVTVHMGAARVLRRKAGAITVDVGNPHLVRVLVEAAALDRRDLTTEPDYDREQFPCGVNQEFVVPTAPGRIRMRVYERGVGETRSCGTGTVAATAALLHLNRRAAGKLTVDVPGGRVHVTVDEQGSTLTGPATFVAHGELDPSWWASAG